MDLGASVTSRHHLGLPLLEYSIHICELAYFSKFNDASLKTVYWASMQNSQWVDLPEMGISLGGSMSSPVWSLPTR